MDYPKNLYAILGINPGASEEEIRTNYRFIAKNFHPDVNKTPGAFALFRDVNEAYQVLSSPVKKQEYDRNILPGFSPTPLMEMQTLLSRSQLQNKEEEQILYALVKIRPLTTGGIINSAPMNLSLIIDASTSMGGHRMHSVKSAARRVVDNCQSNDVISIISFSDFSNVIVPATPVRDPLKIKSMVSTIQANGATAMLGALQAGLQQIERNRDRHNINHIVLITDGRTYGDEEECLGLAKQAQARGVRISCLGIGEDWNDRFLDEIASSTGGSSAYISKPEAIDSFLQNTVRTLAASFAERVEIIVAPLSSILLEEITRVSPNSLKLQSDSQPIPLGAINGLASTSLMLQFRVNTSSLASGPCLIGRIDVSGDIIGSTMQNERVVQNLIVSISSHPVLDDPPPELVDALSGLTLHKLQNRARESVEVGDYDNATRQLKFLATRLLEQGEEDLAKSAIEEAEHVELTKIISDKGAKTLNYGTRALMEQGEYHD